MPIKHCLIIANGEECSAEITNRLLAGSSLVVVLDGALFRVLEKQIPFNILMGDFDHFRVNEAIETLPPEVEIIHTPDQEKTDLDKGIELAINRGYTHIDIIWATGRRADHSITNMTNSVRYAHLANICLYDDYSTIYPINNNFSRSYKAGTTISLVPVGTVTGIQLTNLRFPLNNEDLILGFRAGTSNEVLHDGEITITYQSGHLLLMECVDKD